MGIGNLIYVTSDGHLAYGTDGHLAYKAETYTDRYSVVAGGTFTASNGGYSGSFTPETKTAIYTKSPYYYRTYPAGYEWYLATGGMVSIVLIEHKLSYWYVHFIRNSTGSTWCVMRSTWKKSGGAGTLPVGTYTHDQTYVLINWDEDNTTLDDDIDSVKVEYIFRNINRGRS